MSTAAAPLLSVKSQAFCDALLSGSSKRQAAISAGYSVNGAAAEASRLLRRPDVQTYLQRAQARGVTKTVNRRERILAELDKLAFATIEPFVRIDDEGLPQVDFSNATPEQLSAITSVQTKRRKIYNGKGDHIATEDNARFTLADKYRGLELLGKAEGLFGNDKVEVVVDVADRLLAARQRADALSGPGSGSAED